MSDDRVQLRHKPPAELERPRELIVACPPMRSNVNLSRIVRAASCCGVRHTICCGNPKIDEDIARIACGRGRSPGRNAGGSRAEIEVRRTLPAVLKRLREEG